MGLFEDKNLINQHNFTPMEIIYPKQAHLVIFFSNKHTLSIANTVLVPISKVGGVLGTFNTF